MSSTMLSARASRFSARLMTLRPCCVARLPPRWTVNTLSFVFACLVAVYTLPGINISKILGVRLAARLTLVIPNNVINALFEDFVVEKIMDIAVFGLMPHLVVVRVAALWQHTTTLTRVVGPDAKQDGKEECSHSGGDAGSKTTSGSPCNGDGTCNGRMRLVLPVQRDCQCDKRGEKVRGRKGGISAVRLHRVGLATLFGKMK